MSNGNKPKFSAKARMLDGRWLSVAVWNGKKEPKDEVITITLDDPGEDGWTHTKLMTLYRDSVKGYVDLR